MSSKYYIAGSQTSFQNLYCLESDGSTQYSVIPAHLTAASGSIAFWMKPLVQGFNDRPVSDTGGIIYLQCSSAVLNAYRFVIFDGAGKFSASAFGLTINNWYHLVGTWDSSFIKFYVDGALIGSTAAGALNSVANPLQWGGITTVKWNGRTAAQYTFDTDLSLAQVGELYALEMGDASTLSFAGNVLNAWSFPGGTTDYPTQTAYYGSSLDDGVMTNMSGANIILDTPP